MSGEQIKESIDIIRATPAHVAEATGLLNDYFETIGVVLRDDAAAIGAFLADPSSALWIARVGGQPAGCVALRPLDLPAQSGAGRAAECKRLYVGGAFRRRGLAEALMAALERHAHDAGYAAVYLDSKDDLHAALRLYRQLGYADCPRYNDNPQATVFMCKALR